MKTILINRTLTTIALLSTIQCGYITAAVSSWSDLMNSFYSTEDPTNTYTLNKYSAYELNTLGTDDLTSSIKLVIPSSCTVTNDGNMTVKSNLEIENNGSFGNSDWSAITTYAENSSITFSGSGDINNEKGSIHTNKENSSIMFSAGTADKPQIVTTSGISSKPGQIYLGTSNSSMTIGQYSILSFGDYGKFYSKNLNGNVTLNGTIEIASINASVDTTNINFFLGEVAETVGGQTVTVNKDSHGTIDMSPLRPYSADSTTLNTFSNNNFFKFSASQALPNIKLPFNCKFNSIDLSNAASVSYTVLKIIDGVEIDGNKEIKKKVTAYGDYANDSNLGVTLPQDENGTIDTSKVHIENKCVGNMSLSALAADTTTYNILGAGYKLLTDDLDSATHEISDDTTYHFGFTGSKAISISGNGIAKFMGDNSGYEVAPTISVSEVEFGNKSLFQFAQTYVKRIFIAGNFTNTIPAGAEVKFTGGFTLGAGHTLIVKGTLIG